MAERLDPTDGRILDLIQHDAALSVARSPRRSASSSSPCCGGSSDWRRTASSSGG